MSDDAQPGQQPEGPSAVPAPMDLSVHVESLFAYARTLTGDPARAAALVEETIRKARQEGTPVPSEGRVGPWLFSLMNEVAGADAPAGEPLNVPEARHDQDAELASVLHRYIPEALNTLPSQQRRLVLLMLHEQVAFTAEESEAVLGLEPGSAGALLEDTLEQLCDEILNRAAPAERVLLNRWLTPERLRIGLRSASSSQFGPAPPSLHLAVHSESLEGGVRYTPPVESSPQDVRNGRRQSWRQLAAALSVIVVMGALGYLVSTLHRNGGTEELTQLVSSRAGEVMPGLRTQSTDAAEQFVLTQLGWRLSVPDIDQAVLNGSAVVEIADGVRIPAFIFEDKQVRQRIVVFVVNYAVLDRAAGHVRLDDDVLRQIEDERHFDLHDLEGQQLLVWRNRDDIYIAVARQDAASLRRRIVFPS